MHDFPIRQDKNDNPEKKIVIFSCPSATNQNLNSKNLLKAAKSLSKPMDTLSTQTPEEQDIPLQWNSLRIQKMFPKTFEQDNCTKLLNR